MKGENIMELDMTAAMAAQKERYLSKSWVGRKIDSRLTYLLRFCKDDIKKHIEEKTSYYKNKVYFGQGDRRSVITKVVLLDGTAIPCKINLSNETTWEAAIESELGAYVLFVREYHVHNEWLDWHGRPRLSTTPILREEDFVQKRNLYWSFENQDWLFSDDFFV
jgi:hypothetical protein